MKRQFITFILPAVLLLSSCAGKTTTSQQIKEGPTAEQENMIENGWSFNTPKGGDLGSNYGLTSIYVTQDNYFYIRIGEGFSVAIKIVDADSDKCIRYVYVPENETVTIDQIPQGRYYLKLAYGKDWMETTNDGFTQGKFTRSPFYEKSTSSYDFGKKNSQSFVNDLLEINVIDGSAENSFETMSITEEEFDKN